MEIPEKLLRFKYHILIALILCIIISTLIFVAPKILTILAYFWPLLLSTALFLFAVLVFGKTSSLPSSAADKTGEGLLDFVAGDPDHHLHHHRHHHQVESSLKTLDDEHAVESSKSE